MPIKQYSKEAVPARGGGRGRGRGGARGGSAAGGGAAGGDSANRDSANRDAALKLIKTAKNTLANKPDHQKGRYNARKKYAMNVRALRTGIEHIKRASIAGDRSIRRELERLYDDLGDEFKSLKIDIQQLQDGHSVLSKDVAEVKGTIEQLQDTVAEQGERLTALEADAASKEELAALKKEQAALKKELADMKAAQAAGGDCTGGRKVSTKDEMLQLRLANLQPNGNVNMQPNGNGTMLVTQEQQD